MPNTRVSCSSPNISTGAVARRGRPAKGIDVPATLWLPPADTVPDTVLVEPAVLPAWALRHAIDQYATPGETVLAADTRGFYAGDRHVAFHPLPAHHDPHHADRPAPRRGAVRLAVLQLETVPQGALDVAYPGERVDRVTHFVRPALREAADALSPGGVLAIALAPAEPGHGAQHGPLVLHLAHESGFAYQQHITVLTGDLDGERIIPRLTDAQARAVNAARRDHVPALAPTHLDLAIFTRVKEDTRA
ncbi:MAG TPA: hypothetical protein VGS97_17010 [Actinocrinis sp.]|uniref:hypothetical protein n=1 Tax=Actinocrinis sp. TaxID=1920516 RepID=UPI002DDDAFEA|nr:hypothetical protein [Actinocrinis sp.]HEV2345802.1 hypothetical protein [Actinocrinis sp.]